ncbi:MAG: 50S ribosomal protein L21 [Gammaproteobacteria bacterium]|jgi:large subunit ribosomal protein L21|nr:50S ribosomal protein L21 [Gammaproteobacteria bacterium]
MYAVISTGGKQYKLAQGDVCRIEKLDAEEGATVEIDKVLMIADGDNINIGTPFVDGGKVTATVKAHGRAKKVEIMKFRRRKHHQKRTGHRQYYTEIEVTGISA